MDQLDPAVEKQITDLKEQLKAQYAGTALEAKINQGLEDDSVQKTIEEARIPLTRLQETLPDMLKESMDGIAGRIAKWAILGEGDDPDSLFDDEAVRKRLAEASDRMDALFQKAVHETLDELVHDYPRMLTEENERRMAEIQENISDKEARATHNLALNLKQKYDTAYETNPAAVQNAVERYYAKGGIAAKAVLLFNEMLAEEGKEPLLLPKPGGETVPVVSGMGPGS